LRRRGEKDTKNASNRYASRRDNSIRKAIHLRHVDEHLVVVEKPTGLTTMRHAHEAAEFGSRAKRYLPPTLEDLIPALLSSKARASSRVVAVHRLDRDTSGLVVFARTKLAARKLGTAFRSHAVGRRYMAIVRGWAEPGRIETTLVEDRGDGRRGSGVSPDARRAVTQVRIVERLGRFTLVECELETGRTHQVRIHLGERGTPICGERLYDRPLHGSPLPDDSGSPRLALHASYLAIDHPATGRRMEWHAPLPTDLEAVLVRLRATAW
jgi:23S rRNA pseudouridine1911/1915/1917 synthase